MIMDSENKMREIVVEKVTFNIGAGAPGEKLDHAKELLGRLLGAKVVETKARKRNPVWGLRPGVVIGVKTTLRGKKALEMLDKALTARKRILKESNFDNRGNFSFGIPEYIDFPGAKYDPNIGMLGFDVCVSLTRRGIRVAKRNRRKSHVGNSHIIKKEEGIAFAKEKLGVKIEETA